MDCFPYKWVRCSSLHLSFLHFHYIYFAIQMQEIQSLYFPPICFPSFPIAKHRTTICVSLIPMTCCILKLAILSVVELILHVSSFGLTQNNAMLMLNLSSELRFFNGISVVLQDAAVVSVTTSKLYLYILMTCYFRK